VVDHSSEAMNFQLSDPERDFLKNWLQNSRVERNDSVLKEAWFFIASPKECNIGEQRSVKST
jgi:hypothetical protein